VTWLVEKGIPFSLVFTKTDKIKKGKLAANEELFLESLSEYVDGQPAIYATSAKSGEGRLELLNAIGEKMHN